LQERGGGIAFFVTVTPQVGSEKTEEGGKGRRTDILPANAIARDMGTSFDVKILRKDGRDILEGSLARLPVAEAMDEKIHHVYRSRKMFSTQMETLA
jgi:hypothetical protein